MKALCCAATVGRRIQKHQRQQTDRSTGAACKVMCKIYLISPLRQQSLTAKHHLCFWNLLEPSAFPLSLCNTETSMCLGTCSSQHRGWICTQEYAHKTQSAQQVCIWQPRQPPGKGELPLHRHSIPVPETSSLCSANPPKARLTETCHRAGQPKIPNYPATEKCSRHIPILFD